MPGTLYLLLLILLSEISLGSPDRFFAFSGSILSQFRARSPSFSKYASRTLRSIDSALAVASALDYALCSDRFSERYKSSDEFARAPRFLVSSPSHFRVRLFARYAFRSILSRIFQAFGSTGPSPSSLRSIPPTSKKFVRPASSLVRNLWCRFFRPYRHIRRFAQFKRFNRSDHPIDPRQESSHSSCVLCGTRTAKSVL